MLTLHSPLVKIVTILLVILGMCIGVGLAIATFYMAVAGDWLAVWMGTLAAVFLIMSSRTILAMIRYYWGTPVCPQ
jgi:uncharacterized membrane protein